MADEPIIRSLEGEDQKIIIPWDSKWINPSDNSIGGCADYAYESEEEERQPYNTNGLSASDPLTTAVILCLFTDKRRPDALVLVDGSSERRGWHGDTYDIDESAGEREMGSLIWTLERNLLNYDTKAKAIHFASESLQTLVDQGVVHHWDVDAVIDTAQQQGRLVISIEGFDPLGESIYSNQFSIF